MNNNDNDRDRYTLKLTVANLDNIYEDVVYGPNGSKQLKSVCVSIHVDDFFNEEVLRDIYDSLYRIGLGKVHRRVLTFARLMNLVYRSKTVGVREFSFDNVTVRYNNPEEITSMVYDLAEWIDSVKEPYAAFCQNNPSNAVAIYNALERTKCNSAWHTSPFMTALKANELEPMDTMGNTFFMWAKSYEDIAALIIDYHYVGSCGDIHVEDGGESAAPEWLHPALDFNLLWERCFKEQFTTVEHNGLIYVFSEVLNRKLIDEYDKAQEGDTHESK